MELGTMKPKIQNTKYKILPFRKLAPGLVLLSFVLSGILAPVSLTNKVSSSGENSSVRFVKNKVLAEVNDCSGKRGGEKERVKGAFGNVVVCNDNTKIPVGEYGKDKKALQEAARKGNLPPETPNDNIFTCGIDSIKQCFGSFVYYMFFAPAAYILSLAGQFFDIMMAFTLSSRVLNSDFAKNGWVVTRDLANMFFIFILLYIAIATILEIAAYNAKALLARLIIVALLLNFSLFFTRVIIDASNILGLAFYNSISYQPSPKDAQNWNKYEKIFGIAPKGISFGLVNSFNPARLMGITKEDASVTASFIEGNLGKLIFVYLFSTVILLVAAWAFLSVAFLFVVRTAVLWFLMATAPIAFAAIILPKTREIFTKWWGELMSKSFCVAVFLFFLWLITMFAETSPLKNLEAKAVVAGGISSGDSFLVTLLLILIQFSILLTLIIVAKQQTQKMCGAVAGFSMNFVSGLGTKAAGFLAGGVGGFALRNTLGAYAFKKSDEWTKAGYGAGGLRERLTLQAARKIAGASFNVKATKLGKTAEFGKAGGKGGYSGWVKERTAKDVAFARSFGVGQKADDAREAFAKELAKMGTTKVFSMGTFGRMITGRGVLSKVQPEKAAKEVGKMAAIGRRIREGEENVMSEAADAAMREGAVEYDTKGGKKKYVNMESVDLDIADGILEKSDREKIVNAAVSGIEKHAKTWADTLDNKKAKLAPLMGSRSPKDRKAAVRLTKEIGTLNRNLGALKEHRRLEDKKAREGRTEEKPGATSSGGGASGGTKTP